jgi:hypothetical protein
MWAEIIEGAILLSAYVYHRWIKDHPKPPPFQGLLVPRSDEGAPIPIIYGRCRVRAPVLIWSGNTKLTATDPHYEVDMAFVLGMPYYGTDVVTRGSVHLRNVWAGDIRLDPAVNTSPPNRPAWGVALNNKLGGIGNGGGIYGSGEYLPGFDNRVEFGGHTFTRMALSGVDTTLIPSYHNLAVCTMYSWSIGESPTITGYSFEVEALSSGTPSDFGQLPPSSGPTTNIDAEPASALYDLLTSPWGKLGLPASKIDRASFQAAATILITENHGYSRAIEQQEDAWSIIVDILRQIDGVLYEEPTTSKLVLRLIRNDYDVNGLDTITPDNARPADGSWFSVAGWEETLNQVRVTFTDRQRDYVDGVATAQNGANFYGQGKLRSTDLRFQGCCTKELAQKIAGRELAVVSKPIVKASVVTNRSFYQKRPGDVVKLTWPPLGVFNMIMRIARVDLGQLHKGEIHLDLIRDVFDVAIGAFPVP